MTKSAVCSLWSAACSLRSSPDEIVDFAEIGEFIDAPGSAYSQGMTAWTGTNPRQFLCGGLCYGTERGVNLKTMTIDCPDRLVDELDAYVKQGWALNTRDAVVEALRRFLESHRPDISESQILEDVEWGLHGKD